jgi:hypothetical protein
MVELFTYKLLQNYLTEFVPEIKWLDVFTDQYSNDLEERPFKSLSCFIEFQPRMDITTSNFYRNDGDMRVSLHLVFPRSDNYTIKKKNVNDTFLLQNLATKVNAYMNGLDSTEYPLNSVYKDNMLIDATTYYNLSRSHLVNVEHKYNAKFQIIVLTYLFRYSDKSTIIPEQMTTLYTGWTYSTTINTLDPVGAFGNDFSSQFDVRSQIDHIWFEKIVVSGNTLSISGHSFIDGVPIDLEYGVIDNDTQLPTYQSSPEFTLTAGSYWVYMRDTSGRGRQFPTNPIVIN